MVGKITLSSFENVTAPYKYFLEKLFWF